MAIRVTWNSDSAPHGVWTGRVKSGHTARIVRSDFGGRAFVGHVTIKGQQERPMVVSRATLAEAKRAVSAYIEANND